jgi:hypothetical protein
MISVVVGLCLLALGVAGVAQNWWAVVDFVRAVLPVALIIMGTISMVAGITGSAQRHNY